MRKSVLGLLSLICLTLVGCGKNTGTTMIWEKDGFTVKVSTTEEAVVVPETCIMRSSDGFIVKILDGDTARTHLKEAKNMGNLSFSVQDNGNYLYTVTYMDYTTETPTEEIDYVIGLEGVDLVVVTSASESGGVVVDMERLISFEKSLNVETKGDYTAYNWETFLTEATEEMQEQFRQDTNSAVDSDIQANPNLAQEAIGKDAPETQEDYDKILEYENTKIQEGDTDSYEDFNFKNSDNMTIFSFNNALYEYAYNAEDSCYISTDDKFKITLSILDTGIEDKFNNFSENYARYSIDDQSCVAINEAALDCNLFWQVGHYATQINITKNTDGVTYDELLEVLSYINTMRTTSLYTFDEQLAEELGINAGYRTTNTDVIPVELKPYEGIKSNITSTETTESSNGIETQEEQTNE